MDLERIHILDTLFTKQSDSVDESLTVDLTMILESITKSCSFQMEHPKIVSTNNILS
jgi:hypothetical protein